MLRRNIHPGDLPLFSEDLQLCQKVFDRVRLETGIEVGTGRDSMLAANIIHFYKQGIKDPEQLLTFARISAVS